MIELILKRPSLIVLEKEVENHFSKNLTREIAYDGEFAILEGRENDDHASFLFAFHEETDTYLLLLVDEKFIVEKKGK